jgi:hypothetical protein
LHGDDKIKKKNGWPQIKLLQVFNYLPDPTGAMTSGGATEYVPLDALNSEAEDE